jgi:hypothetical protein
LAIRTWFNDAEDNDLEIIWKILEQLVTCKDIPQALAQVKRELDSTIDATATHKVEADARVSAGFNSPTHQEPLLVTVAGLAR